MDDREKPEFLAALKACAAYYDRALKPEALAIYWAGLQDLPIEAVRAGLNAHVRDPLAGQYMPKVADVRRGVEAIVAASDGHPGPDEAWSIALPARNESATVVWTEQIAEAFYAAAMPLLEAGDKIAARKAFQERYEVELRDARSAQRPASWRPSLGTDQAQRAVAIEAGVQQGRLQGPQWTGLLPNTQPLGEVAIAALEYRASRSGDAAKSAIAFLRSITGGRAA